MDIKKQIALEFAKFQDEYLDAHKDGSIYLTEGHNISKQTYELQNKYSEFILSLKVNGYTLATTR